MPVIELFGVFTKPAALTVRLFANMMGGHIIVIVLTLLIFILGALGAAAAGGTLVVSLIFSVFMLLIDVLVSFIPGYVFTMLDRIHRSCAGRRSPWKGCPRGPRGAHHHPSMNLPHPKVIENINP